MTTERSTDVRKILSRLGRLRARIRAVFATIGISRWVVAAVGLLAVFFLADWLLDLPLGVRRFVRLGLLQPPGDMSIAVLVPLFAISALLTISLTRRHHGAAPFFAFVVAGLLGVLVWLAIRLSFPMRVALPDQELALAVESRFEHLEDRLAAALDFEREIQNPTRGESVEMMRTVVHEAADAVRGLRFSKAVSGARAARWAGVAALAVALAAIVTFAFKDTVGLWAQRSLLLADVSWPRATTMVAVDLLADGGTSVRDPKAPYDVSIGRSLTVYAKAQGDVPDGAHVLDLVRGQDPLARRMFAVPGSAGIFAYEFRDVRSPFSFILRGGDDDDDRPQYEVEVTIPPRVIDIRSTVAFPEYLGRADEEVADGSITVPEGSKVSVAFRADVEIEHAAAVIGEQRVEAARSGAGAQATFTFAYEALESGPVRLLMTTPEGKHNDPSADTYEVRVKRDQAPRVEWIYPRLNVEVTPNGRVPLLVRSTDDHGVTQLTLEFRAGSDEVTRYALREFGTGEEDDDIGPPLAVNDGAYGRRQVLSYLPIEVPRLRTPKDEKLLAPSAPAFRVLARDSRGQTRESDWITIDVEDPAGLERGLALQRANVRLGLEAVQRDQKSRRDEVAALLGGAMGRSELDLLKTIRFAQSKITQDADRALRELFSIFNTFVYDRFGSPNANAKILGFLDRHHRETYGLPPTTEQTPRRPARAWVGDPVFPYALYDRIVGAWRAKEIYDKGLLDKMCAVVADGTEVGSRLAPKAHAAATQAVSGATADVRALLAAQEANLIALDALLESMRGWQSLNDLTLTLRKIIDEQQTLIRQMEKDQK